MVTEWPRAESPRRLGNVRLVLTLAAITLMRLPLEGAGPGPANPILLRPQAVFDGKELHPGWVVLVEGDRIQRAGLPAEVNPPNDARVVDLPNDTLTPGLIEGHSHLFLHPYNETSWNDQIT